MSAESEADPQIARPSKPLPATSFRKLPPSATAPAATATEAQVPARYAPGEAGETHGSRPGAAEPVGPRLSLDTQAEPSTKEGARPKLPKPTEAQSCPRCGSVETKFCYYNNYNQKQPRYFCKGCQRYWTAGGTLRNVPVGAGKRKRGKLGGANDGADSVADSAASAPADAAQQSTIPPMQLPSGAAGPVPSPFSMFHMASSSMAPASARLMATASRLPSSALMYNSFAPQLASSANPWAPQNPTQYGQAAAESSFAWSQHRDPSHPAAAGLHSGNRSTGHPAQPSARPPSAFQPSAGLGGRRGSITQASSGLEDVLVLDRQLSAAEPSTSLNPGAPEPASTSEWPLSSLTPQNSQALSAHGRQQASPSQLTEVRGSSAEPSLRQQQSDRQLQRQASQVSHGDSPLPGSPQPAGFQPFAPSAAAAGGKQHEITKPAAQDWISMAAASQQQAALMHMQHAQMQQAAALQLQMQAAAAWPPNSKEYLAGMWPVSMHMHPYSNPWAFPQMGAMPSAWSADEVMAAGPPPLGHAYMQASARPHSVWGRQPSGFHITHDSPTSELREATLEDDHALHSSFRPPGQRSSSSADQLASSHPIQPTAHAPSAMHMPPSPTLKDKQSTWPPPMGTISSAPLLHESVPSMARVGSSLGDEKLAGAEEHQHLQCSHRLSGGMGFNTKSISPMSALQRPDPLLGATAAQTADAGLHTTGQLWQDSGGGSQLRSLGVARQT